MRQIPSWIHILFWTISFPTLSLDAFLSPKVSNPPNHNNHYIYKRLKTNLKPILQSSRSDSDGNFDPSAPSTPTEAETADAANTLLLTQKNNTTIDLPNEISNSFLQYSLSIILGRALPDARDGLKPVHRRILYAMNGLNLHTPTSTHRKCARVVGEVLGKYHPHGDTAVYDALVRMAQDFATGTPLIDGHGNFGSLDHDPPAAMRYTECRLTPISSETLLEELNFDTVELVPNFDGNEMEPVVLPAKIPLLLLNGCSGIAVGMATNVPPHNLKELMDACIALAKSNLSTASKKKVSDKALFKLVPGPDFPTGAVLLGTTDAQKLYETGHGGVILRAVTHVEEIQPSSKSNRRTTTTAIVVTELPYQVNKSLLLEKIAQFVNEKKIEGVADLRDESDREGVRIVMELKRDAEPQIVLNNLFQKTSLQTTFSGNFLALMGSGTKPERFTLRSSLNCFLEFRFETIRRKAGFQLNKVETRLTVVEGLLLALKSVDQVIDILKSSPDTNTARTKLTEKLSLSAPQTDAVLKLQLGQLTRLNQDKLLQEQSTLQESSLQLQTLLNDDDAVWKDMIQQMESLKKKYGIPRRTQIIGTDASSEDSNDKALGTGEINELDLITNGRSVIVVTNGGYIKRLPLQTFSNQKRGTRGKRSTANTNKKKKDNDNNVSHCFTCNDHDTLLIVTYRGVAFGLRAYQIPVASRTARGVPIPSVLPFKADDVIASILPVSEFTDEEYCVLATESGWIKKTPLQAFENLTSRGLIIAKLEKGDRLRWFEKCTDANDVLIGSRLGMASRFNAADLRPTGRMSRGIKSMKLKEGDSLTDMSILDKEGEGEDDKYILVMTKNGYGKRVPTGEFRARARGGVGVIAIKFKKASTEDIASCLKVVKEEDEVLLTTEKGIIVRQNVKDIPSQGRAATGVRVQKIDEGGGDGISSVSIVSKIDDENEQ